MTVAEGAGQLPVPFRRAEAPAFGNFFVEAGAEVVDGVRRLVAAGSVAPGDLVNAAPKLLFLHGAPGSGKTHLLVAALRAAADLGQPVAYLDLADGRGGHGGVAAVDGLPPGALVCLDRADAVAGSKDGELNLFAIFERLRAAGARMLIAARAAPGHLPCAMPDLRTRLASGLTYRLPSLSDAGKAAAMRAYATRRGLTLSKPVLAHILRHHARDTASLFQLLDKLDRLSMARQRKVTVALLRELGGGDD
ncbi:MAG: DnaA regulatory inactivator Hda [Gammaproteobacteria bacterium]|nr:DnaA regulatory inactivator Hda [Gammaproteobacteria bacterium]MDD9799074.1 DnaA regulatory inactivator Hda [Gammaproteobacteria bacterium]MDD9871626.1 DnaA regulatory inactivator Hda [Gammaproteobacteria bacterium]